MSNAALESRELVEDFANEAIDSLPGLPAQLAAFRANPQAADPINAVFRAIHSIKGNAGFFGFAPIKSFAHTLENTLDRIRQRELALTEDLERALVESFDELAELVAAVLENRQSVEPTPRSQELLERIAALATAAPGTAVSPEEQLLDEIIKLAQEAAIAAGQVPWAARLRDVVDEYRAATGAATPGAGPTGQPDEGPAALAAQPWIYEGEDIAARLAGVFALFTAFDRGGYDERVAADFLLACEDAASWAHDHGCEEFAVALRQGAGDFQKIVNSPLDIDALLLSVVWESLQPHLVAFHERCAPAPPSADAPATPAADAETAAADGQPAARASAADNAKNRLVRVKEERLDEFLEHVSSLFITGELFKDLHARLGEAAEASDSRQLGSLIDELRQINQTFVAQSSSLQETLVSLRMVTIGTLFNKFPRMARSLAQQLGKQVDVHLSGEEIEIDKSLIEDLDAPLTHMIRNVMDHGIEAPDARRQRGASETGNLWLRAEKTRTHIRVYVQDDGRGIDPRKMRDKAAEKGLMSPSAADALSDEEAIALIFHAGFSTAEKLTEVSGRGVGMDVVRTKIQDHNGEVVVESKVNVGTTFCLEIPQREAVLVIDGLMLRHAGQNFVLPFEHIQEITELRAESLKSVHGSRMAIVRDKTYPAVSLSEVLQLGPGEAVADEMLPAVVVGCKFGNLCLLADRLLGHRQVVVNSLGEILPGLEKIAGVAQLGGGRMALVLSIPEIVRGQQRSRD